MISPSVHLIALTTGDLPSVSGSFTQMDGVDEVRFNSAPLPKLQTLRGKQRKIVPSGIGSRPTRVESRSRRNFPSDVNVGLSSAERTQLAADVTNSNPRSMRSGPIRTRGFCHSPVRPAFWDAN